MFVGKEVFFSCVPARLILAGSLFFTTQPVLAQMDERQNSLQQCYNIEDAGERLACYDFFVKTIVKNPYPGVNNSFEVEDVEPYLSKETRQGFIESQFGISQVKKKKTEILEPESIAALVKKVTKTGRRNISTFHFENGQIWRQVEPGYISIPKDDAFNVVVSKSAIGGYRLRVDGKGMMVRVKRLL